jgi:RES domain-containing protein
VRTAWRLVKEKYAGTAFDGEGARRHGGRWNHPGTAVVYVSGSMSLAALETFVHLGRAASGLKYVTFAVDIPDAVEVTKIGVRALPANWRSEPPGDETKQIGTEWADKGETAVLDVPSVIIPGESNLLLNPAHTDFRRLVAALPRAFSFDPRMWK